MKIWIDFKKGYQIPAYFRLDNGKPFFVPVRDMDIFGRVAEIGQEKGLYAHPFIPALMEHSGSLADMSVGQRIWVFHNDVVMSLRRKESGWEIIGSRKINAFSKIKVYPSGNTAPDKLSPGLVFYYLRKCAGYSAAQAASMINVSPSYLSKFERSYHGDISLLKLEKLCEVFNIPVWKLLRLREETVLSLMQMGVFVCFGNDLDMVSSRCPSTAYSD